VTADPAVVNTEHVRPIFDAPYVDILAAYTPPPGQALETAILLAEVRRNLVARLLDDGHPDQAGALAAAAISAYRAYAAMPGADIPRTGRDLAQLAAQLAAHASTSRPLLPTKR
jgi:hypothetical protein